MFAAEYFSVEKDCIKVDTAELSRRLCVGRDFDVSVFDGAVRDVLEVMTPKCCFVKVDVSSENGIVDLGFVKTESRDLCKNLDGCKEAFVFAVTLGHGVDRLLSRLSLLSPAEFFVCDAVSSAFAESVCDAAEEIIRKDKKCKPRFSPGYGDSHLSLQKDVLAALNAQKLLGITLTDSNLMTPQKSITAVMGAEPAQQPRLTAINESGQTQ